MKYYAIKRPDGTFVMAQPERYKERAWGGASLMENALCAHRGPWHSPRNKWWKRAESEGYRCVEVSGFVEVQP